MRTTVWLTLLIASACGPSSIEPRPKSPPPQHASQKVGEGYYLTKPPPSVEVPVNAKGQPVLPKVTPDFAQIPTSNEWWSSIIWQFDARGPNPYSDPMYPHPLTLKAQAAGLEVGYPTVPKVDRVNYMYWHQADLTVGISGQTFPDTRVAGYSDWAVTAAWDNGNAAMRATAGHGLPFVYFTKIKGGAVELKPGQNAEVFENSAEVLGLTIGGRHFAAFAPTGSKWSQAGGKFSSDLAGKEFFSLAVLPDRESLPLFAKHAYAFVTDTKVSWEYDEKTAKLTTKFEVKTDLVEPGKDRVNEALQALYRHQWKFTKDKLEAKSYVSPRGEMKLHVGSTFTTVHPFGGVLPILPNVATDNELDDIEHWIKEVYWVDDLFPPGLGEKPSRDAYWIGKSLLKSGLTAELADQVEYENARDDLIQAMKNEIEDWFDGRKPSYFYYLDSWRTLLADPPSFGSGAQMNDHHFHWGYFVYAAAIIARHDPAWAKKWAPFIEILIRDASNFDRGDDRFPFLRWHDPYVGHAWANGPSLFEEGNNEESSSEDANYCGALILWGSAIGNKQIRDLGIFLYANLTHAVDEYWFDVDDAVYPKNFDHTTVAMVWSAGGRYDTWWDGDPSFVHGINMLPITGLTNYLGRHPAYIKKNYGEIVRRNRGEPLTWRDILWMYLAYSDPKKALELFWDDPYFAPEYGNSRALTYHHISNMLELGHVDFSISADTPTYSVFRNGNKRTYIAYNPTAKARTVTFSNGTKLEVPARKTAFKRGE